jgi:hypothetical protein
MKDQVVEPIVDLWKHVTRVAAAPIRLLDYSLYSYPVSPELLFSIISRCPHVEATNDEKA